MHSYFLKGTRLVVEEARPKESEGSFFYYYYLFLGSFLFLEGGGSKRLFIGKIGPNVKKHDILKAFSSFGDIIDILLKEDFAFVVKKSLNIFENKNMIGIFQ